MSDGFIKALTLHEPWATLMKLGHKKIETRSWRTDYRGPLVIHAAKTMPEYARDAMLDDGFTDILGFKDWKQFRPTLGCGLCLVELVACVPTTKLYVLQEIGWGKPHPSEAYFGNYDSGRWAWATRMIRVFEKPIPRSGERGLWNWM